MCFFFFFFFCVFHRTPPSIPASPPTTGIPSPTPRHIMPMPTPRGRRCSPPTTHRYTFLVFPDRFPGPNHNPSTSSRLGVTISMSSLCVCLCVSGVCSAGGAPRSLSKRPRRLQPGPGSLRHKQLPPVQPILLCGPDAPEGRPGSLSQPGLPPGAERSRRVGPATSGPAPPLHRATLSSGRSMQFTTLLQ